MISLPLLIKALQQPDALASFSLAEWDLLLRQARSANLMGRLCVLLDQRGMTEQVPPQPREHLEWSRIISERHIQTVQWEVALIRKALAQVGVPIILLKGAAYVMANLPHSHGRLFSDIDIMVPKDSLNEVEAALMLHGWATNDIDEYDQRYYRQWMHELPPMQHLNRLTVIDVHHAILPETAYVHPNPEKLRAAACRLDGYEDLLVFAPVDMVLHSAAHLFHEGELHNGLRDLVDIDSLLRHFSNTLSFWPDLIERAKELELTRPLFYALRYCALILNTPIPGNTLRAAEVGRPARLTLALMDGLYSRALMPAHPSCADRWLGITHQLLFVRANWLRMPPIMLARHLFHKAFLSPKAE